MVAVGAILRPACGRVNVLLSSVFLASTLGAPPRQEAQGGSSSETGPIPLHTDRKSWAGRR